MGLSVEDEFQCPKSGYSIDMRVQNKRGDLGVGWAMMMILLFIMNQESES
jgi:hypothetical protein